MKRPVSPPIAAFWQLKINLQGIALKIVLFFQNSKLPDKFNRLKDACKQRFSGIVLYFCTEGITCPAEKPLYEKIRKYCLLCGCDRLFQCIDIPDFRKREEPWNGKKYHFAFCRYKLLESDCQFIWIQRFSPVNHFVGSDTGNSAYHPAFWMDM